MPQARSRSSKSFSTMAAELAQATPQVMAHRITRMALAGPTPSTRDRREFQLMSAEKGAAFAASWNAMAAQAMIAQQTLALSMMRSLWMPMLPGTPSVIDVAAQFQRDALTVLDEGMAPLHRTAVANAKRLARTRLR